MPSKEKFCPYCNVEKTCNIDPFNGAITCSKCKNYLGQDESGGPVVKMVDDDHDPFSLPSDISFSQIDEFGKEENEYIETDIESNYVHPKSRKFAIAIVFISVVLCVTSLTILYWFFFVNVQDNTPLQEEKVSLNEEKITKEIVVESKEIIEKKVEEKISVPTLKSIERERIILTESVLPSVILLVKILPGQSVPFRLGTGFIINEEGYIFTNYHVINGNEGIIRGILHDGSPVGCILESFDEISDIALLRILDYKTIKNKVKPIVWGKSQFLKRGQTIFTIGHPQGFPFSFVSGVIANPKSYLQLHLPKNEEINSGYFYSWIQVDASFHQGLSGGPLFNLDGEVVGINTRKSEYEGIGFCIPANYGEKIANKLIKHKQIVRSSLGIIWKEFWQEENEGGVLVHQVIPYSPAYKAGIQKGDIVYSLDGVSVQAKMASDLPQVRKAESELFLNKKVLVKIKRSYSYLDIFVLPELRQPFQNEIANFHDLKFWGIPISPSLQAYLKNSYKVGIWIIDIDYYSPLKKAGILTGDIILGTDRYFQSSNDFFEIYRKLPLQKQLILKIQTGQTIRTVKINYK